MTENIIGSGPMLNAYPDSCGNNLNDMITILKKPEFKDVFTSFYILPSIYNSDLDRGFSVIDYGINEEYADRSDIDELCALGIDLKLDFILNHASVFSPQFIDLLKNGRKSKYADFFIDWNKFWEGYGQMTPEGYIKPDDEYIRNMIFRKNGLPILMVRLPEGIDVPYWNTFYQEVRYKNLEAEDLMDKMDIQYVAATRLAECVNSQISDGTSVADLKLGKYEKYRDAVVDLLESRRRYLGQMDLNIKSPLVWEFYANTLKTLASYGAKIVRLDAFAYAPKEPGEKNFLNDPGTWDLLQRVRQLADDNGVTLLPEIHASYGEKIYELVAGKG